MCSPNHSPKIIYKLNTLTAMTLNVNGSADTVAYRNFSAMCFPSHRQFCYTCLSEQNYYAYVLLSNPQIFYIW